MIKNTILIRFLAISSFSKFVYAKPVEYENVAITFDACDGKTDMRLLNLIKDKFPLLYL